MDFNVNIEVVSENQISEQEAYKMILAFNKEESTTSGMYKIQIDEFLNYYKKY